MLFRSVERALQIFLKLGLVEVLDSGTFYMSNIELLIGQSSTETSFPAVWEQYIEKLSEYMASTGKRYQSHAATIRRWAGEDARKAAPPSRNRDYSVKEDETV